MSRRIFLQGSALSFFSAAFLSKWMVSGEGAEITDQIAPKGPASSLRPVVHAAFVRRKGDYGMRWPGAVYDGEAARRNYANLLSAKAQELGLNLSLRSEPIYGLPEADAWLAEAKTARADGIFVALLDRQEHSWPTAQKAAEAGLPTVIFSPLGSSFTTNTAALAERPGCVIYSTDDFAQPAYGLRMLGAAAKMRRTRCVVIKGTRRLAEVMPELGIELRTIPAAEFLDEYHRLGVPETVVRMADEYTRHALRRKGPTAQDVINGIKSYCVAGGILRREKADAITMDCLGALGNSTVSLPCIAWSRMNDDGIPAACEADLGAVASHVIVQYLFDRPGFQQDPVADTNQDAIIGAHCCCPTRLNGFRQPPEPFELVHHHGNRDAVPRTLWRPGQRVTCLDVLPGDGKGRTTELLVSAGAVIDNIDVPPAGGCVVSVRVKFDGNQNVLSFPGFHQVFFYGDFKKQIRDFGQLCRFKTQIV